MTFDEALVAQTVTQQQAFAIYDALDPVAPDELIGSWKGSVFRSGHPADGYLASNGWFGKRFESNEKVAAMLFQSTRGGNVFSVDPAKLVSVLSLGSIGGKAPDLEAIQADAPTGRLRTLEFRGKYSAALIYDQLPIHDHFRRINSTTIMGAVDARGDELTQFFVLHLVP